MTKREDKGFFTQLPVVLIDEYSDKMPATSFVAFIRFYRHYGYKGIFKGSVRKLCAALNMARMSVYRAIEHWVKCGLVRKGEQRKIDENRDEMVLLVEGNDLWKRNIEYSKGLSGCPKLGQSASAEESTVPENKGSVPIWDNGVPGNSHSVSNRDGFVPDGDDFVPTSSSKSPPKITEDYLKITVDKTEDSDDPPTSSQPDDSFIPSSDLNLISPLNSQGGATDRPSSVKGMQNSKNMAEIPQNSESHIANGQGYTNEENHGDNNHPDEAVMENSTVSEAQVLAWVKRAGVAMGLKASCDKAVATLLPLVHGQDDIEKLVKIERKIHPTGITYIANLARPEVIQILQESPGQDEYVPSKHGMTAVECEALMYEIWIYDADIALSYRQNGNDRWFVAIFIGDGRYKELGSPDDWPKFLSFAWLGYVAQAIQYGRDLPRQQTERQREAIAV